MAQAHVRNEKSSLWLVRKYLPPLDVLDEGIARHVKRGLLPPHLRFKTPDGAAAWLLASRRKRECFSGESPREAIQGVEVIVLGPPLVPEAELAEWFIQKPDCRLIIEYEPKGCYGGSGLTFYDYGLRSDKGPYKHLKPLAKRFLNNMLDAYGQGDDVVTELLNASGHPYVRSRGFINL